MEHIAIGLLEKLREVKRRGILIKGFGFLVDNKTLQQSLVRHESCIELRLKIIHSPKYPDLTLSDFLFPKMKQSLKEIHLSSSAEVISSKVH